MKIAYVITKGKDGKSYWDKIGVAFENKDGSLSVKLSAFPVNGELQIREYDPTRRNRPQDIGTSTPAAPPVDDGGDLDDKIPF